MNLLDDTFPTSYHAPQMEIVCQSYAPEKLIHQTTQNGVHKTVGFSSSGVMVLDFIYDKNDFGASVIGKSPYGQVYFLLNPKSLRSRQKGANFGH